MLIWFVCRKVAKMINTPLELFNAILTFKPDSKTNICHVHKECKVNLRCALPSSSEVLGFDSIEEKLATGKRSKRPSCDGVALSNDHSFFCFVEMKGWQEFVERNICTDTDLLSGEDLKKIETKAEGYNLKGKLEHSIKDCEEITSQLNLLMAIPYVYIIVTDIKEEQDADKDIALNLSSLAGTASVWQICDESMINKMNTLDSSVKKVYTHCCDFDKCLENLHF